MNWDQVKGTVERAVTVILVFAVAKGWITKDDVAVYSALIVGLASVAYGFYVNRNSALLLSAAAVKDTTVVTTPELAIATPAANVVSSDTHAVVPK